MSTIRDDGPPVSSGITPSSDGGTLRSDGSEISSGTGVSKTGTVRGGGPDISSGSQGVPSVTTSLSLKQGETISINNTAYQYHSVISKSTGEAELFLLTQNSSKCVFKLYYPNFKPKEDIVKQLRQLKHKDIINVIDYGYYHDRFFEIMEYAEGGTIEQYLPIRDINRINNIVAEIANAFKYCHAKGIIHKDIKPQNLYYKDAKCLDIVIGDFGISTLLDTGMSRHLTSQSLTVGYAAPEMYGVGGKVYVGKEVDYYALGITIIHIWDGRSPFDGLGIHAISNLTTSGKVRIPADLPKETQKLVKGLITVDYVNRWGYAEISRWLKGEDVPVHFQVKETNYPPYKFSPDVSVSTAVDLATILDKNKDKGKKHLYGGKLSAWVNLFDQGLAVELDSIVEEDYPKDQDAGLQKAIYLLEPDQAYISKDGKKCNTIEELADALEADSIYYMEALKEPNHSLFLYLEAHDAKKEADTFKKYFNTYKPKKALNATILALREGSLKLGNNLIASIEDLLKFDDRKHLIEELKDGESQVSVWLEQSKYKEIYGQVKNWRKLDWRAADTLVYALKKSTPFSSANQSMKSMYYDLAKEFTLVNKHNLALKALQMAIELDSSLASTAVQDESFFEIREMVLEMLAQLASKTIDINLRSIVIDKLKSINPTHSLIKRAANEEALFDKEVINKLKALAEKKNDLIVKEKSKIEQQAKHEKESAYKNAKSHFEKRDSHDIEWKISIVILVATALFLLKISWNSLKSLDLLPLVAVAGLVFVGGMVYFYVLNFIAVILVMPISPIINLLSKYSNAKKAAQRVYPEALVEKEIRESIERIELKHAEWKETAINDLYKAIFKMTDEEIKKTLDNNREPLE